VGVFFAKNIDKSALIITKIKMIAIFLKFDIILHSRNLLLCHLEGERYV
jgi:hypothetical protein